MFLKAFSKNSPAIRLANWKASALRIWRTCISERVEPQFTLPLGEIGVEDTNLSEFISQDRLSELPPRYQKGVEQAVSLFRHLEHKTGVSFAPPFTALLGALDEAARGLMIDLLGPDVPQDARSDGTILRTRCVFAHQLRKLKLSNGMPAISD